MIIIPAVFLLVRRALKLWRTNEAARARLRSRRQLGYGWYPVIEAFRREWTWRPNTGSLTSAQALKVRLEDS